MVNNTNKPNKKPANNTHKRKSSNIAPRKDGFVRRIHAITLIAFILLGFQLWKLIIIQIRDHEKNLDNARRQSEEVQKKTGLRGSIFDTSGKTLARSMMKYTLVVNPAHILNNKNMQALDEILNTSFVNVKNKDELMDILMDLHDRRIQYRAVGTPLTEDERDQIAKIIKKYGVSRNDMYFDEKPQRVYTYSDVFDEIVGLTGYNENTNTQGAGVFGIENKYNNYLKPRTSSRRVILDKSKKNIIPTADAKMESELDGKNIYLTIDADIQKILNEEVGKTYRETGSLTGIGVILDPRNGKILGATSYNNGGSIRNSVFQNQYEPGSVFKPLIMAAALNEKLLNKNTLFDIGDGTVKKYGHTMRETSRAVKGILSAEDIIVKSSNVGMVLIGDMFSNQTFADYLTKYGFYNRTGVDFSYEMKNQMTAVNKWDKLKKSTMSFGQGIAVTPIQMASSFAAVINGGTVYRPYLVDRVEDQRGQVIRRNVPHASAQVLSPKVSQVMRDMLHNTVETGTGIRAKVDGIKIGGKTGTGQLPGPDGRYLKSDYLASFIGFFPVDDPQYVILLMFEKPNTHMKIDAKYGGAVAAPTFANIVNRISLIKSLVKTPTVQNANVKKLRIDTSLSTKQEKKQQTSAITGTMPDLTGASLKEVINILGDTGIDIVPEGVGFVVSQEPEPGSSLTDVYEIKVKLSND